MRGDSLRHEIPHFMSQEEGRKQLKEGVVSQNQKKQADPSESARKAKAHVEQKPWQGQAEDHEKYRAEPEQEEESPLSGKVAVLTDNAKNTEALYFCVCLCCPLTQITSYWLLSWWLFLRQKEKKDRCWPIYIHKGLPLRGQERCVILTSHSMFSFQILELCQ